MVRQHTCLSLPSLKGQRHVTVKKTVISRIYIVAHMWHRSWWMGVNPLESYSQKSTNISAIVQHMNVSSVSLQNSRVHLQNNTFILRNVVENHCDMAYQNYCKIVISKEVCLQYVTLPPLCKGKIIYIPGVPEKR